MNGTSLPTAGDEGGRSPSSLIGRVLVGPGAERIGTIVDVYLDHETRQARWVTLSTGRLARRTSCVPLRGATWKGDALVVPYTRRQVRRAPAVGPSGPMTEQAVARLDDYYGRATDPRADGRPA